MNLTYKRLHQGRWIKAKAKDAGLSTPSLGKIWGIQSRTAAHTFKREVVELTKIQQLSAALGRDLVQELLAVETHLVMDDLKITLASALAERDALKEHLQKALDDLSLLKSILALRE